jgi:hypothetical protein
MGVIGVSELPGKSEAGEADDSQAGSHTYA